MNTETTAASSPASHQREAATMDEAYIYRAAKRVVEVMGTEFGDMRTLEAVAALSGALLMTAREFGVTDSSLLAWLGVFMESTPRDESVP